MKLKIRNPKKCGITISMNINKNTSMLKGCQKSGSSVKLVYVKDAMYLYCVTKPDSKFIVKKNGW